MIPTLEPRAVRVECVLVTWWLAEYFEGALADAPAWTGWLARSATAASVPATITTNLDMTASIRFETTQTEPRGDRPCRLDVSCRSLCSASCRPLRCHVDTDCVEEQETVTLCLKDQQDSYAAKPAAPCQVHVMKAALSHRHTRFDTASMRSASPRLAGSYFAPLADSVGRATPHGSYFLFGSGIRSSAAL